MSNGTTGVVVESTQCNLELEFVSPSGFGSSTVLYFKRILTFSHEAFDCLGLIVLSVNSILLFSGSQPTESALEIVPIIKGTVMKGSSSSL